MTNERLHQRPDSPTPQHSSPDGDRLLFLAEALRTFHDTGALAPSGPQLVNALVVPVTSRPNRPISVLEVGAGTGVVTRRLAQVLRPGDRLHVVEANRRFADRLREDPVLAARPPGVGLRLSACRVEELPECRPPTPAGGRPEEGRSEGGADGGTDGGAGRYDVIVSGLPFTNFEPEQVHTILDHYLRLLSPGGELTYFGYLGTTTARTLTAGPRRGARHRAVARLLRQFEAAYGLGERTVWRNLPPARAYLLRAPGGRETWEPTGSAVRTNDNRQISTFR
ncbi:class I SAM-dependent methyltransferase [Kitasatospora brasiliensis]|uniref:class I SAM-dependent methyltransferase n=1 Tax=Kitasatospora brasiliensis TaxID=3058040 RepID=UPI00292D022D|nr:class I SAM-dependent methyltransferase [Kitasatospora sp. K002]